MTIKLSILIFLCSIASANELGLVRTVESQHFLDQAAREIPISVAIPSKFDLTPRVSPPENQGNCGSCWDFAITKGLRSALMLVGKDPGRLAFNYLLHNCGPGPRQSGCGGGDFDAGESMLEGAGPWLESQDPYLSSRRCKHGLAVAGTALAYKAVGSNSRRAPTFQELAGAVSQGHQLIVDVAVCGAWGNYRGGIFDKDQCSGSNHMINLNGYDCESSVDAQGHCLFDSQGQPANGDGYLIVMNNWGTKWGEKGYMRTRFGVDNVASNAMYFDVAH